MFDRLGYEDAAVKASILALPVNGPVTLFGSNLI